MAKKKLIIIRHAHRDVFDPLDDNGLSEKGRAQARNIRKYFEKAIGKAEVKIFSSPRLRCQETLAPICSYLDIELETLDLLDEGAQKKGGAMDKRIKEFKTWWIAKGPSLVLICSHGDWIPEFTRLVLGESIELKKGGWAELHLEGLNKVRLGEIIQKWE